MRRPTLAALLIALVAGASLLWWTTDGLRAFSTEGARRLSVELEPRELPDVRFEDQRGNALGFDHYRGHWLLVEFIYTRCPTLCTALGLSFQQIARVLSPDRLGRDVFLLSVSFDPANDDAPALQSYAERFQADGEAWRVVRVEDRRQLSHLLETFGIVVIPDDMGGFEHNGAIHLVGRDGRLRRIYDYGATPTVIADLRAPP